MGGLFSFQARGYSRSMVAGWLNLAAAECPSISAAALLAAWRCSTLAKIAKCQLGTILQLSFEPSPPARPSCRRVVLLDYASPMTECLPRIRTVATGERSKALQRVVSVSVMETTFCPGETTLATDR